MVKPACALLFALTLLQGCPDPSGDPDAAVDASVLPDGAVDSPCGRMCSHFRGLECAEGEDFYDSDKPGPVDVPNTTCEEFCETQMDLGVDLNTTCATKAPTCEEIEAYRAMMDCK